MSAPSAASAPVGEPGRQRLALALMAASGFAGLGYQIVWTQQSALALGHESAAVLAVVAAFFGGLAVGALALGRRIEQSRRPRRWYVACELVIAAWSAVLLLAMAPVCGWIQTLTGEQASASWQWTVAFVGTFVLLLPATAAMGATLPAMERICSELRSRGRSIAALYAANTLGAVAGVLAAAFWLVPTLGLSGSAGLCIVLNLLCAAAALRALPARAEVPAAMKTSGQGVQAVLFATGLLGIGYEVLIVRVLSQVAEDTVYTFALLLAVYLAGTAVGAALYHRRLSRFEDGARIEGGLLAALASACLLGFGALWSAAGLRDGGAALLGNGMAAALGAEALPALAAFALPTLVMGALFSHLGRQAADHGVPFGRALGLNTLGAALAPLLFGVVAVALLGLKGALLAVVFGYLGLALATRRTTGLALAGLPAAAALALAVFSGPLAFVDVPDGGRIVSYDEGPVAAVSVVEDGAGVARLRIDNRQQEGSSATRRVDGRQAVLPLLLHAEPRQALFLGLGTGVTASVAAEDPALQVDAVELLPEVIAASRHFAVPGAAGVAASGPRLIAADARRFVRVAERRYDVIVADNFHPARSGSGALYTVEHFAAVRGRLAAQGLFCQWLPLHQLDLQTLASIVRSFTAVFPQATALLASNSLETPVIGLIGLADGKGFDLDLLRRRLAGTPTARLAAFGVDDEFALLGAFVAGPAALARFGGRAEANTDDRPVVAYGAPRIAYAADSRPGERLVALLHLLSLEPSEILRAPLEPEALRRLVAYWAARDGFVEAGLGVRPAADVRTMLAQVREPLLGVLRTSPDFRPAYDPLLLMAERLGRSDFEAARGLLEELARLQPARPEAAATLRALALPPGGAALTTK